MVWDALCPVSIICGGGTEVKSSIELALGAFVCGLKSLGEKLGSPKAAYYGFPRPRGCSDCSDEN